MTISVEDAEDSSLVGASDPIYVGLSDDTNSSLALTASSDETSVRLIWMLIDEALAYVVFRDDSEVYIADPTTTEFTDTGLSTDVIYEYRVEARDILNEVITSESIAIATKGCVTTISIANGNNEINLPSSWSSANSPYCVLDDVAVNSALIIEPGASVRFADNTGITVNPSCILKIEGDETAQALLTSMNSEPSPGDWDGIHYGVDSQGTVFNGNEYDSGSLIKYAIVEYAGPGITSNTDLLIEYSLIRYNKRNGGGGGGGGGISFHTTATQAVVRYCNINHNESVNYGTDGGGAYFKPDDVLFAFNTVSNNNSSSSTTTNDAYSGGGIYTGNNASISQNTFVNNSSSSSTYYNPYSGGAIYAGNNASISQNTFVNNSSSSGGSSPDYTYAGGAIYIQSNGYIFDNQMTENEGIAYSYFNKSFGSGGICINGNDNAIYNNQILQSSGAATRHPTAGDLAVGSGAIIVCDGRTGNAIYNNTLLNNTALISDDIQASALYIGTPDGNLIHHNHIVGNQSVDIASPQYAVYVADGTGALSFTHNNLYDNLYIDSLLNESFGNLWCADVDTTHSAMDTYFGGETSDKNLMYVADSTTTIAGAGEVDVSGARGTAWVLCVDEPGNADCVGADFEE